MRSADIIAAKRDGQKLAPDTIASFVRDYVAKEIPDYQMAAFLMAVFFRGMTPEETAALTRAMIDSGDVIPFAPASRPRVDKHSTGGVGDKVSLILAPLAAAAGVRVPMMSGRALGHTGGTLDKLDSIPGYRSSLDPEEFVRIVDEQGYAMTGQTERIVPADRRMYALRDVTSTVESVPLITGSILSKKFAEGADALVFDVKCGSGAFMKTQADAQALAESLVQTGEALGRRVIAVMTRMDEPLGSRVGNLLEVQEAVELLRDPGSGAAHHADLMEVTLALAAWMLRCAGLASSHAEASEQAQEVLRNGTALSAFRRNVEAQGGDWDALERLLDNVPVNERAEFRAPQDGYLTGTDCSGVGLASVYLGVGRNTAEDSVDPYAGIRFHRKVGDPVKTGELVAECFAADAQRLEQGTERLGKSLSFGPAAPEPPESMVIQELGGLA